MIRKFETKDLLEVVELWLSTNIQAHDFIFVSDEMQSKGIGKQLLEKAKELYSELSLTVYQKNIKAVNFYQREQFIIKQEQIDENTGEIEYLMVWSK